VSATDDPQRVATLVVPGRLSTRTGGYEYDRRIVDGLARLGWLVAIRELEGSFPFPTSEDRSRAAGILADLSDRSLVIIDGLAMGALPDEVEREAGRLRLIALVHHPLALETGLNESEQQKLEASERRALAVARRVVVTSRATARVLGRYGVAADVVAVVEPGTDPAPLAAGSCSERVHLLCVASLVPRKGHEVLLRALARVRSTRWHLTCAGGERSQDTTRHLRALVEELDLIDRVAFCGEADADRLATLYDEADLFVLPTLYEGYGMVVAEALARGLPIVSTTTGAIPEIVPPDAGRLVPPGDVTALAHALAPVIGDGDERARLAEGARRARTRLPSWGSAAEQMSAVLDDCRADLQVRLPGHRDG
jgi:glycosyltransferase involved in cell wall biosynthesis